MARPKPDELVGLLEIADICGVERGTPWRWRNRGILPEPLTTISGTPIWWRPDIEAWARKTKRAPAAVAV